MAVLRVVQVLLSNALKYDPCRGWWQPALKPVEKLVAIYHIISIAISPKIIVWLKISAKWSRV